MSDSELPAKTQSAAGHIDRDQAREQFVAHQTKEHPQKTNEHPPPKEIRGKDAKQGETRFGFRILIVSMILIAVAFGLIYLLTQTVFQPEVTLEQIGDQTTDNAGTPAAPEAATEN